MKKIHVVEIIAGIFILVFVFTGLDKFWHLKGFEAALSKSLLISKHSSVVAWAVPVAEITISVFLFIPKSRVTGFGLSFLMMLAFTLYISYMLVYEPNLPCSCGGVTRYMSWKQHLIFNVALVILALYGIFSENRKKIFK